jgi:hypothetical protein
VREKSNGDGSAGANKRNGNFLALEEIAHARESIAGVAELLSHQ